MKDKIANFIDNIDNPDRHEYPIGQGALDTFFDHHGEEALRWALRQAEEVDALRAVDERLVEMQLKHDTRIKELEEKLTVLEAARPHWAQGYTSDGVAAQVSSAALSQIWDQLGAKNQTDAMEALSMLKSEVAELKDSADHLPGIAYLSGAADREDVCRKLRARVDELEHTQAAGWYAEVLKGRAAVVPLTYGSIENDLTELTYINGRLHHTKLLLSTVRLDKPVEDK